MQEVLQQNLVSSQSWVYGILLMTTTCPAVLDMGGGPSFVAH